MTHLYNLLIALKQKLPSIDSTRKLAIEQQYRKLCEKSRNQDVDKWLNEWIRCFNFAKNYSVKEAIQKYNAS